MATQEPTARIERREAHRRGLFGRLLDAVYGALRWIGGHVRGFYAAVGLFLVGSLAVAVLAVGFFAMLAEWVGGGATQSFDDAVNHWARTHTSGFLDWLALVGALLGSGAFTWIVLIGGTVVFWLTRHHWSAALLWVSLFGARVLNGELKAFFDRPRPKPMDYDLSIFGTEIGFPTSGSFPSGHAITSAAIFGTLTYLVIRLEPTVRLRRLTVALAVLVVLLVGLSRVYLGVHYPSDVMAGWLAGFVWATGSAFAIEAVRYFAARKPEVRAEEEDLEKGLRPIRETVQGEGTA